MNQSTRPTFICHMMQTLDGKIASGIEGQEIIMDFFDLYTDIERKLDLKVWMFGRKTAAAFAGKPEELPSEIDNSYKGDYIVPKEGETFVVVIDTQGSLRWENNYISLSGIEGKFHLVTIVTEQTHLSYLQYLRNKNISYIVCGKSEVDLNLAATKLKKEFEIEKVLLEGGGSFNGSMMAQGLVDEISLLLLPRVLNKKGAPSLFDQETNELHPIDFKLQSSMQLDRDVLWLRYSR